VSIDGQSRPEESSVYLKTIVAALALGLFPSLLMSQSMPTAVRRLNVQVGGLFSVANPGVASDATIVYGQMNFKGGGMYATIDPANHLGLEMSVRQVFGTEGVHERTYSAWAAVLPDERAFHALRESSLWASSVQLPKQFCEPGIH
jgi:hypothetical protein